MNEAKGDSTKIIQAEQLKQSLQSAKNNYQQKLEVLARKKPSNLMQFVFI